MLVKESNPENPSTDEKAYVDFEQPDRRVKANCTYGSWGKNMFVTSEDIFHEVIQHSLGQAP